MMSAPASAKASRNESTGEIIRWTSNGLSLCGRRAFTTAGPMVRFGTKCPSITSTWIQSAPAASAARTSSPSRLKSAESTEGAIFRVISELRCTAGENSSAVSSGHDHVVREPDEQAVLHDPGAIVQLSFERRPIGDAVRKAAVVDVVAA